MSDECQNCLATPCQCAFADAVIATEKKSELASPAGSVACACVNHDAFECARIRDGGPAKDEDDYHRRACECCCHKDENYDEDD